MGYIVFSYISTGGAGGNHYVSRVATKLRNQGHDVEMRHGSGNGSPVKVGSKPGGFINFQEWMMFWQEEANQADVVVIFDSEEQTNSAGETYAESAGCQAEYRYAKSNCPHVCVGRWMDDETVGYVAAKIHDRLESKMRRNVNMWSYRG
jgi:hypothetical protein